METVPLTPPSDTQFGVHIGSYACRVPTTPSSPTSQSESGHSPPIKPKQSKSRNGCITCKAKRLKCDETKPTCLQCQKRGVECGGFKKDFKWRPFEESSIGWKPKQGRKGPGPQRIRKSTSPPTRSQPSTGSRKGQETVQTDYMARSPTHDSSGFDSGFLLPGEVPVQVRTPPSTLGSPVYAPERLSLSPASRHETLHGPIPRSTPMGDDVYAAASTPNLALDMLEYPQTPVSQFEFSPGESSASESQEEQIEEIPRIHESSVDWVFAPSRASGTMTTATRFSELQPTEPQFRSIHDIFQRPAVRINSSELLINHFDKHTCGIMSVKDGPHENPWRTLIWPMALDSPALFHAISAMTAFHMSRSRPALRVDGIEHMRKSIRHLASGLSHNTIPSDAALATTLVLAFSEAFDRHISTGIQHLRGARGLLSQALSTASPQSSTTIIRRYQFLYNVWVYLDVLAHLTSDAPDDNPTLPRPVASADIDPLLGCATTLFPLLSRAANIGQRVRSTFKNTLRIITAAQQLQLELQEWTIPKHFNPPEDAGVDVAHCRSTAEAYRAATLLYLHQTVPEIESADAHELAGTVLRFLASVPVSSRCVIVHIFPLLAAGCEAVGGERRWVEKRWRDMMERMWIGNVEKAWTVTEEVWRRRDVVRGSGLEVEGLVMGESGVRKVSEEKRERREFGARGKAHWLGVMKDWDWEVLLG